MKEVYLFRGQGGALTSQGIDYLASELRARKVYTMVFDWDHWENARRGIDSRASATREVFAVGYSMGANALTWLLNGVHYDGASANGLSKTVFKHVFFLDPTWAAVITPITNDHAKAATHFQNHSIDLIGQGEIRNVSPEFKNLVVVPVYTSHLLVDKLPSIQKAILNAIL